MILNLAEFSMTTQESKEQSGSISPQLIARLQQCKDLPSPPGVATRILELGESPSATLEEVANVVNLDPTLAAKILRMASSPLYAQKRKAENLRQAIILFGLNGTLTLALSFSLVSSFGAKGKSGLNYGTFWRRSLAAAIACRVLGERLNLGSKEDFFLAGLLQDIGILALEKTMPELYARDGEPFFDHDEIKDLEIGAVGVDHAAVGGWLLKNWNLPERWVVTVAASHDLQSGQVEDQYQALAKCVAVSSAVADIWSRVNENTTAVAARTASELLGVDHDMFVDVVNSVDSELREIAPMFDIDPGDPILESGILEQAKEILTLRNLRTMQHASELQATAEALESRTHELEEKSRRDGLTGLFNRVHLDEFIEEEFRSAKAHGWPLTVAFVDLDHFKKVNDTYGHGIGDVVLQGAAKLLCASVRDTDLVARYGGEEFVVVLPGTPAEGATVVCDRIVKLFGVKQYRLDKGVRLKVTTSVGFAVHGDGVAFDTISDLMKAADEAVYAAKRSGRNRWVGPSAAALSVDGSAPMSVAM